MFPKRLIALAVFSILALIAAEPTRSQWSPVYGPEIGGGTIVTIANSGQIILAGTPDSGAFRSLDDGISWRHADSGIHSNGITTSPISDLRFDSSILYAATQSGVYLSTDSGTGWTSVNTWPNPIMYTVSLAFIGANLFAATGTGGVYRTTDRGNTWQPGGAGITGVNLSSIVSLGTDLFAATWSGVFRSTDSGRSWSPSGAGSVSQVMALAVSGSIVFAGTSGYGVFRSTDSGRSWAAMNSGLPASIIIDAIARRGQTIFAASYGAVYQSKDSGETWTNTGSGLPSSFVLSLSGSASALWAGTDGGGVYRLAMPQEGIGQGDQSSLPLSIIPTPIISSGRIEYALAEDANVSIVIYDLLGRAIATPLASVLQDRGPHSVPFDGSNLAPGVYYCRLSAAGVECLTKLVIDR